MPSASSEMENRSAERKKWIAHYRAKYPAMTAQKLDSVVMRRMGYR